MSSNLNLPEGAPDLEQVFSQPVIVQAKKGWKEWLIKKSSSKDNAIRAAKADKKAYDFSLALDLNSKEIYWKSWD